MDDWFEELVVDAMWKAIRHAYEEVANAAVEALHDVLQDKLNELNAPEKLSDSPLVAVVASDATTLTFLVRGRFKWFGGAISPFFRIEVVVSRTVPEDLDPPVTILDWNTVVGDLKIEQKNVFNAEAALGWDNGVWLGRGVLKVLPAGFGLDILLGGISDRGIMIGLDVDFPAPIPLGPTGLALSGVGGDFAYNFIARLEKDGILVANPTAEDYVRWARNHEPDRWEAGPIDQTAVGIGIRADLRDVTSNGFLIQLEPIGLAVLTPGPVFVLGGKGKLLKTDSAEAEGYLVVDIGSGSLALGLGVKMKIPKDGPLILLNAEGTLDALFSFSDPSLWYVNFGTNTKPIKGKVLATYDAELFLMLNNNRVLFGAGIGIGGQWKWWVITLIARIGARVGALVGWNPVELEGAFKIWGELGLKIWKFKFVLLGEAEAIGHTPKPTQLDFRFYYRLDLPWPIPNVDGHKTLHIPEAEPAPPDLASPLLVGSAVVGGGDPPGEMALGAIHAITGRQWELANTAEDGVKAWPDLEIVLPFTSRVTDTTNTVVGPAVGPGSEGGYQVDHTLTKVELRDLVTDTVVPDVKGVWVSGPGGDTARLHLLGLDPFSWLSPHTSALNVTTFTPPAIVDQYFGLGAPEPLPEERRFGHVLVKPLDELSGLVDWFAPTLPTRVLHTTGFGLRFADLGGNPFDVDRVTLILVIPWKEHGTGGMKADPGTVMSPVFWGPVYGELRLAAVEIALPHPVDELQVFAGEVPLLVYSVRYRRAPFFGGGTISKTVLTPSHYRLTVEGDSKAVFPDGTLPDSPPVTWTVDEDFWVGPPESLRPYVKWATLGDPRIFLQEPAWDPTMIGVGFPIYLKYRPVVRFLVPYMEEIFDHVRMRLGYEDGPVVEQTLVPSASPDPGSSLPASAQAWLTAAGGTAPTDQELAMTIDLPQAGAAAVQLWFDSPTGEHIHLDEWTAAVSRFDSFRHHLAWAGSSITTFYTAAGVVQRPPCAVLPPSGGGGGKTLPPWWHGGVVKAKGRGLNEALEAGPVVGRPAGLSMASDFAAAEPIKADRRTGGVIRELLEVIGDEVERVEEALEEVYESGYVETGEGPTGPWRREGPLIDVAYPGFGGVVHTFPDEYDTAPSQWVLPPNLGSHLGPLEANTGVEFCRFARDTGARFTNGVTEPLTGIGDIVPDPVVEAVVDSSERPLALWLRTPEPVDWRRVSATLQIHHVQQTGPCPSGYAERLPLDLAVEVLPSPDGSSAFLVGRMGADRIRLPRGEYRLTLRFDAAVGDLPILRPSPAVGPTPETLTLTFLQPAGMDWPLPKKVEIPPWLIDLLYRELPFPPEEIEPWLEELSKRKEGGR